MEQKKIRYDMWFTEKQIQKLEDRTRALGFTKKSDYIRFMVFMELSFSEKIDQIHRKVCCEDATKE